MKKFLISIILIMFSFIAIPAKGEQMANPTNKANMANPASVNCVNLGGTLEIRKDENGGEYGVCKLPNGVECEEWALFRGECSPEGDE